MNKTKLGLSYGLTASLCYFSAIISTLTAGLIMIMVLYVEENEDLRFNVLQAFTIAVFMGIVSQITYIINLPFSIDDFIRNIINALELVVLIYAGIKAKDNDIVTIPIVTKWLDEQLDSIE